eukprot:501579-Prorocentrum_minimum.AAC.1
MFFVVILFDSAAHALSFPWHPQVTGALGALLIAVAFHYSKQTSCCEAFLDHVGCKPESVESAGMHCMGYPVCAELRAAG